MKADKLTSPVLAMVCFFCFVIANAEPSTDEAPSNLLSNGSFEKGDYSPTGSPIDWGKDAFNPSAIFTWDDTQARTGYKSVKIYAPIANDVRWIQTVDVGPNTVHFLSGWIKTENVAHTSDSVDAGASLSLYGTWERSAGVFGSQDWIRNSILFNSEDDTELTIGARLGYWAGTTTGTAWFDDLHLEPILPMDPHPSWKILVLIYQETDFEDTDDAEIYHHYVASMTQDEMEQAALVAKQFVEIDIPALTSGNMVPEVTVRFPDHALTRLMPIGEGWWPSPMDTASDRDPEFDSVIVIWDPRAIDLTTGGYTWIGSADGRAAFRGTHQTYYTMQLDAAISRGHRNVFKHEWGHSILSYFDAIGTSPKPAVSSHVDASQYVNCHTWQLYVWEDETLANPIPNSIYNNDSGFTHDYYSGNTATADQPSRCLGIPPEAWALGGPVSHSGNMPAQTFSDVPTDYWAYSFVEILAASEITSGCGGNNYCPGDRVTRAQMAVFLERGMKGSSFSPPAATGNIFLDVFASDFAASFIEQLFFDGITAGCGNNSYCPYDAVTRAQMAVFLLRSKYGAGYTPPPATGVFDDVNFNYWAVHWIEQLAAEGITVGCGGGNYCPEDPVTRAQMAVFLVRTFGL